MRIAAADKHEIGDAGGGDGKFHRAGAGSFLFGKSPVAESLPNALVWGVSVEASISTLPVIRFAEGAEIISEGMKLDRIYFLKSGRLEVVRDEIRVNLIKTPGSVLGEISILLHQPSTATVRALDEVEVYECEEPFEFLKAHPEVTLHMSSLLASRLAAATQYLVDVKDQLKDCSDHVGMVDGVLDSILHRDLKRKI